MICAIYPKMSSTTCLFTLKKIKMRGHSTPYRAGILGKELGCKVVALNHFAGTTVGRDHVYSRVLEAREGNQKASQIIASHDFMEVWIPRGGYNFVGSND